jgi:hypothetical protein
MTNVDPNNRRTKDILVVDLVVGMNGLGCLSYIDTSECVTDLSDCTLFDNRPTLLFGG